jgi:hypothetical protein
MSACDIIIIIVVMIILIFTVWSFVYDSCRRTLKQHKFFMTTAPEFAVVYFDFPYQNVSILGDHVPFQTVQLKRRRGGINSFTFIAKSSTGQDTVGNGAYDPGLDRVLIMIGENDSLELHSESPRKLLEEVQQLYRDSRAFHRKI